MQPGIDPLVGATVGHYRIIERLGAGGMGEVYLAEDLKLKRRAAIKFIAAGTFRDQVRHDRFVQEATLAASIDHPHIAAIYDIDQFGDRTFIAMEYVAGATLRETLRQGAPPLRRALEISIQVADALAKTHQHGVIHRDLKPENVIVSTDGYAKVIDFGLAKAIEELGLASSAATATEHQVRTADGVVMGTVAYMSPEQARGERLDARTDIFSFGVLLYELLTGHAPFRRSSSAETLSAILTSTPPDITVSDTSTASELQRIVRKCLVKDVDGRYQSMRDVVVDLRDVRDVLASATHVTGAATPSARTTAPRGRIAIAAIGVLALIAIAGWLWWPRTSTGPVGRPALAITNFEILTGAKDDEWLSAGLPSMLVTGLAQNPDIEVVTADRLNEVAKQIGAAQFGAIESSRRIDALKRAGATIVVKGTVIRADAQLRIDARVEDLASGRVVLADNVSGRDPLALADDLAARIRRRLNVSSAEAVRPVSELSSPNVEAYRLYAAGVEAANNANAPEAIALFQKAIALDPDFAQAHLRLYWVGDRSYPVRRPHLLKAAAQITRLPERDRLFVEAQLAESEGRAEDALAKYNQLMARYPDAFEGYSGAANYYRFTDRAGRGIEIMQQAVAVMPTYGPAVNTLGYYQLADGRGADALRSFQRYVDLRPKDPNSLDSLAEGQLATGDLDQALVNAQRANAGGHYGAPTSVAWAQAVLGRYEEALTVLKNGPTAAFLNARVGRYRDAEATLARFPVPHLRDLFRAVFHLERDQCAQALALLEPFGKADPRELSLFEGTRRGTPSAVQFRLILDLLTGTCEARTAKLDAARARLAAGRSLQAEHYPLVWLTKSLEGEIALAAGDVSGAVAAFEAAGPARRLPFNRSGTFPVTTVLTNSLILRDGLARARVKQGRADEAIAIYRVLLGSGPESKFTSFYEPRYVLALARLLDKTGKRAEARKEYAHFLELWKNADQDLPELVEARAKAR